MRVITVARKPMTEANVAMNVMKHGAGALHINAARVAAAPGDETSNHSRGPDSAKSKGIYGDSKGQETHQNRGQKLGRWPANLVLGHPDVCAALDEQGAVEGGVARYFKVVSP